MNDKILVFDMDGTIADLYGFDNWLDYLLEEDDLPYKEAEPLYDMDILNSILYKLKHKYNYKIVVTSWLCKDSSSYYKNKVRQAKKEWLQKYDFEYDEIHLIQYGRTKADATRHHKGYQVLIDDNDSIRKGWNLGGTIDPAQDLFNSLCNLMY